MPLDRRTFLKTALGGTAALAALSDDALEHILATDRGAAGRSPNELAQDEDFWFDVQRAYTVDRSIINLNNGGVCPSPRAVQDAMRRYLEYTNHAPARTMWRDLDPGVESVRRDLARTFGCDPDEIAITRNASEALENALLGIRLEPGDEVLTTVQDYPRMLQALNQREKRDGIVVKKIEFPTPPQSPSDVVNAFAENITSKTRVILVCHVIFVTGQIMPVREICRLARKNGITSVVDGAHAFAHFPFQRDDIECDYYGTSLHKWLTAPIGTGFLYVTRDKIADTYALMPPPEPESEDIRKFEEIGTHPAANRLAIAEALRFYWGLGPERKAARLRYLKGLWTDRIGQDDRVVWLTNLDPTMSCGLATVRIDGLDSQQLTSHLWAKNRILVTAVDHGGVKGIRVSPNVYTTPEEIDVFCTAVERVMQDGLPV